MGKKIGEGFKRDGLQYGEQTKAIVYLNSAGQPITAFTGFD